MMEIQCDDTGGLMIQNLCWIFPIHTMNNIVSFNSLYSIELGLIKEFVLMLSLLNEDNGQYFINNIIVWDILGEKETMKESSPLPRLIKLYSRTGSK